MFKTCLLLLISLYSICLCIYSGYIANNNRPDNNSNGLFISSYVICIIQCIIYLLGTSHIIYIIIKNKEQSNEFNCLGIPILLNIYWLVIYFNYNVSEKYDEYALVKTIEFFTILGLFFIIIFIIFPCILIKDYYKGTSKNINNFIESNV